MARLAIVTVVALALACNCQNVRPVIGILSIPVGSELHRFGSMSSPVGDYPGTHYFAASYVKFLESSGARVVPIMYDAAESDVIALHSQLNGVLLTGGGGDLSPGSHYRNMITLLYNLTISAADQGRWVPLWGTCLGFEALAVVISGQVSILTQFNSENLTTPIAFNSTCLQPNSQCRLFGPNTPPSVIATYQKGDAFSNHGYGVSPSDFNNDPILGSEYRLLGTSDDRDGKTFVAAFESIRYPVYGAQYHPEKTIFEWNTGECIPHTYAAIEANLYNSKFFVNETRKNTQQFASADALTSALIYNFNPYYTGGVANQSLSDFEQCYFFK